MKYPDLSRAIELMRLGIMYFETYVVKSLDA